MFLRKSAWDRRVFNFLRYEEDSKPRKWGLRGAVFLCVNF